MLIPITHEQAMQLPEELEFVVQFTGMAGKLMVFTCKNMNNAIHWKRVRDNSTTWPNLPHKEHYNYYILDDG